MELSERDYQRLDGVHPDLVLVTEIAFELFDLEFPEEESLYPFVIEGKRSMQRQRRMVASGASTTLNSRHLTGHAVDIGLQDEFGMRWEFKLYRRFWNMCMRLAGYERHIPLEWGGDWETLRDGPHFQLDWEEYPKEGGRVSRGTSAQGINSIFHSGGILRGTAATGLETFTREPTPARAWLDLQTEASKIYAQNFIHDPGTPETGEIIGVARKKIEGLQPGVNHVNGGVVNVQPVESDEDRDRRLTRQLLDRVRLF